MARSVDIKIDERVVHLKVQMDNLVEDIKEVNYELVELEALLKTQVERLKAKFDDKQLSLKTKKERLETQLRELFEQVPQTETITQRKVRLLNADVVIKKAKTDFEKDTDKLIEWAKVNERDELINKKEVLSFKWADFKKNLIITDHGVIDSETGENLVIDGLKTITKPEQLEIKY